MRPEMGGACISLRRHNEFASVQIRYFVLFDYGDRGITVHDRYGTNVKSCPVDFGCSQLCDFDKYFLYIKTTS